MRKVNWLAVARVLAWAALVAGSLGALRQAVTPRPWPVAVLLCVCLVAVAGIWLAEHRSR